MNSRRTALGFGVAALIGAVATEALAQQIDANAKISWLAIQTAKSYRFDGKTLTLEGISPSTTLFADRPVRVAKQIPTPDFLKIVHTAGSATASSGPVNAGITFVANSKLAVATVELHAPKIDGSSLSYRAKVIAGSLPPAGGETSIFIDDIPWNPGGF
jgi:hypothetical protein